MFLLPPSLLEGVPKGVEGDLEADPDGPGVEEPFSKSMSIHSAGASASASGVDLETCSGTFL